MDDSYFIVRGQQKSFHYFSGVTEIQTISPPVTAPDISLSFHSIPNGTLS